MPCDCPGWQEALDDGERKQNTQAAFSCKYQAPVMAPFMCSETRERHRQHRAGQGLDPDDGNPSAWHGTEAEASELMVYHGSILRNKQLLFAYV